MKMRKIETVPLPHEMPPWNTSGSPFIRQVRIYSIKWRKIKLTLICSWVLLIQQHLLLISILWDTRYLQAAILLMVLSWLNINNLEFKLSPSPQYSQTSMQIFQFTPPAHVATPVMPSMASPSPSIFNYQSFNYSTLPIQNQNQPSAQQRREETALRPLNTINMCPTINAVPYKSSKKKAPVPALNLDSIKN